MSDAAKTPEQHGYEHAIHLAKAARVAHAKLIEPIREAARANGYAVAVHGTIARDVDLVAVPWVDEAASAEDLIASIVAAATKALGGDGYAHLANGGPTLKPHGRLAWTVLVPGGTWLDLSVMPRLAK